LLRALLGSPVHDADVCFQERKGERDKVSERGRKEETEDQRTRPHMFTQNQETSVDNPTRSARLRLGVGLHYPRAFEGNFGSGE
jgi:hypothetical protein